MANSQTLNKISLKSSYRSKWHFIIIEKYQKGNTYIDTT